MARNIPIKIRKLADKMGSNNYIFPDEYLIQIDEKQSNWVFSKIFERDELIILRNELNEVLGLTQVSKKLNCSIEDVEKIQKYHTANNICKNCDYKNIECMICINICQSPLEQALYLTLKKENINADLQRRINSNGESFDNSIPIDKSKIMTIPDFYIELGDKKTCIYADGHTYHERTENQALRDRNIDRELQNLGFKVLRFTGKEIRERMENVIETIKKNI